MSILQSPSMLGLYILHCIVLELIVKTALSAWICLCSEAELRNSGEIETVTSCLSGNKKTLQSAWICLNSEAELRNRVEIETVTSCLSGNKKTAQSAWKCLNSEAELRNSVEIEIVASCLSGNKKNVAKHPAMVMSRSGASKQRWLSNKTQNWLFVRIVVQFKNTQHSHPIARNN